MTRSYKLCGCPACGEDSVVVSARATAAGVLRRRQCSECGLLFSTEERILGTAQDARIVIPESLLHEMAAAVGARIDPTR